MGSRIFRCGNPNDYDGPAAYPLNDEQIDYAFKNGIDVYALQDKLEAKGYSHKEFTAKTPLVSYKCGAGAVKTPKLRQIRMIKEAGINASRDATLATDPAKLAKIAENTRQ